MTCSKAEKRQRRRKTGGSGGSFGIFKCFWPTVNDDDNVQRTGKVGPAPAFIVEKGCGLLQKVASPPPPSPSPVPPKDSHVDKKGRRLGLSAAIKALLSETYPGKKSRKSPCSQDSDASSRGKLSSTRLSERSDSMNGSGKMIDSSISHSTLSLGSSCCSSLSSSSGSYDSSQKPSRSSSLGSSRRQHSFKKDGGNRSDSGLCVFIVTLLVVVLWGKICAIICTSTWLYIMNRRIIGDPNMSNGCSVMDSADYKKRIILGGFLDRKRSRNLTRLGSG